MSEDFKEKLKAYAEGRLSAEDKLLMEKELENLELYQEFLDEQNDKNYSNKPAFEENIIKNQAKIIKKSKWRARLQNACISLSLFFILLVLLQTLTSSYYNSGNPSKTTLYRNAMRAALQTTRPNTEVRGDSFRASVLFSSDIGLQYVKKVGREEIGDGELTLKFRFNKPSIVTDKSPDSLDFNPYYFMNPGSYNSKNISITSDSKMWSRLEKLPEGTVTEASITFNKLYETDEVLEIFKNKNLNLLWLAVDTGTKDEPYTTVGFPHTGYFPQLSKNRGGAPPDTSAPYENGKLRNEYFIKTLEYLNEYKAIVKAVAPMANIQENLNYVNKNGVKIFGVVITGPTKEILKLKDEGLVKAINVGEARLWNWDK